MNKKIAFIPVGIIMIFFGSIWFLQGINVLPGSIMTGSSFWAAAGGLTDMVGLILITIGVKSVRVK
jgi:hypothetical protein